MRGKPHRHQCQPPHLGICVLKQWRDIPGQILVRRAQQLQRVRHLPGIFGLQCLKQHRNHRPVGLHAKRIGLNFPVVKRVPKRIYIRPSQPDQLPKPHRDEPQRQKRQMGIQHAEPGLQNQDEQCAHAGRQIVNRRVDKHLGSLFQFSRHRQKQDFDHGLVDGMAKPDIPDLHRDSAP